jgi:hypothetical protein
LSISSPYTFTGLGYIEVTASADGYTSSSAKYLVSKRYNKTKTIDFGALTASDFDEDVWTTATGAPRDYWTNRAAAIPADATYYKFVTESITPDDETDLAHKSAIDGITMTNCYQRTPRLYVGYGLLAAYDVPKVENVAYSGSTSNNLNIKVNEATAEQYAIYKGWNNYGSGTFTTVQAGNATFALYRYDTMLRTIDVYSPEEITIIGAVDCTSGYRSTLGSDIVVANGSAKKVTFKNHGSGAGSEYYKNWVLDINYGGSLITTLRSDWYAFDQGAFTYGYTYSSDGGATADNTNIWGTWFADMAASDAELTLSHVDGKLYVIGTIANGDKVYYMNYTYGDGSQTDDFTLNLSIDHSWIEVESIEDASTVTTPVHPIAINAGTVGTTGYSTFASTLYPIDLSDITGATAYYAESADASKVMIKTTVNTVPAGEGIILKGTSGDNVTIKIADAGEEISGNLLVGCTTETNLGTNSNHYVLVNNDGTPEFQSLASHGATIPAGKAYLNAPTAGARLSIVFDDETTGIVNLPTANSKGEGAVYNLNGQRMQKAQKGLYIIDGKKVMVK